MPRTNKAPNTAAAAKVGGMIDVLGVGARGWEDLPDRLKLKVWAADVLIGGPRQLGLIPQLPDQQRETWPTPLREGLPGLLAQYEGRAVVALASGDPLVAGVGSTLIELLGTEQVTIHPALSSVAIARARMGWSAESVEIIRLRGDDVDRVRGAAFSDRRLIILSRDCDSPAEIAEVLTDEGFGDSRMTIFANLETEFETRVDSLARDRRGAVPELNLVCVECVGLPIGSLVPGLPDGLYDHDGQLTKRTVRASALAHLMPRPGQLLWDLGAGAGSIGIEWARAHPSCRVVAVEQHRERAKRVQANARALGVPGLTVVVGEIGPQLDELPQPDAVFIGGGATSELINRCWSRLDEGGRLVVPAVTQETELMVIQARGDHGGELTRIMVEQLEALGRYSSWQPARPVVQWSAVKGR